MKQSLAELGFPTVGNDYHADASTVTLSKIRASGG